MERILRYNKTAEGSALYSKYLSTAYSSFPQYVDEIIGISEGANMSSSEVGCRNNLYPNESTLRMETWGGG